MELSAIVALIDLGGKLVALISSAIAYGEAAGELTPEQAAELRKKRAAIWAQPYAQVEPDPITPPPMA